MSLDMYIAIQGPHRVPHLGPRYLYSMLVILHPVLTLLYDLFPG